MVLNRRRLRLGQFGEGSGEGRSSRVRLDRLKVGTDLAATSHQITIGLQAGKEPRRQAVIPGQSQIGIRTLAERDLVNLARRGAHGDRERSLAGAQRAEEVYLLIPGEAAPQFQDDGAPRNGMMPPPSSEMIAPPIAE